METVSREERRIGMFEAFAELADQIERGEVSARDMTTQVDMAEGPIIAGVMRSRVPTMGRRLVIEYTEIASRRE